MSINVAQFRSAVLEPAMRLVAQIELRCVPNPIANNLIIATFCQETQFGNYLTQVDGPGLGLGQIEPLTLANVIRTMPQPLLTMIRAPGWTAQQQVVWDLSFACITTRWYYWMSPMPLPGSSALVDLWPVYRDVWCAGCAATEVKFVANGKLYGGLS
jgi:hypothetical protein